MRPQHPRSSAPGKKVVACVCLLAVFLLWAPAWTAALQAERMACCAEGMCPIHGHAPKKTSHDSDAQKEGQPATCEHHEHKSAMNCSMACCHPEAPVVTGIILFLLPAPSGVAAPLGVTDVAAPDSVIADSFLIDPASPPPRS